MGDINSVLFNYIQLLKDYLIHFQIVPKRRDLLSTRGEAERSEAKIKYRKSYFVNRKSYTLQSPIIRVIIFLQNSFDVKKINRSVREFFKIFGLHATIRLMSNSQNYTIVFPFGC